MILERARRLIRYGTPLPLLLICVLSLVPGDERPHTGLAGQAEHVLAYALTACGLALGFPRRAGWIAAGLALLGGLLEVGQIWIPGRTAQVVDFAASAGGALSGAVLGLLLERVAARRLAPRDPLRQTIASGRPAGRP